MLQNALSKVLHWIIVSSADPNEVSLTLKGLFLTAIPSIMFAVGIAHLNLGQDQVTGIFDSATAFVQTSLAVVGTAITLYGAVRKAYYTMFPPQQS